MLASIRRLTASRRSHLSNWRLGQTLAFVAGFTNAGGFLAVGQYTSHMTGVVSAMMDHLALGEISLVLSGLSMLLAFMFGAMTTTVLIHWARRRRLHSRFAIPLLLEAGLLLVFGLLGAVMNEWIAFFLPLTVLLLCFLMGLQNAVITKITQAEIRTTHITGLVTDVSIELGKMLYWNRNPALERVVVNRTKLRLQGSLILLFIAGGGCGALGFKHIGYAMTLPLALLLIALSSWPALDDIRARYRVLRHRRHG